MTDTTTLVGAIPPITRTEAHDIAAAENLRVLDQLRSLDTDDWSKPTDCPAWDVRALSGHVLGGMETFTSLARFAHTMRGASREASDGAFVDAMTAIQVRERSDLSIDQLIQRLAEAGPRSARWRSRVPFPFRRIPMKEEVAGVEETWRMGYLLDIILTRDTWMHRVDIARATSRDLTLSPEHDGRIVADAVAEWARRLGRPFTLELTGPAGGAFATEGDGEGKDLTFDAIEFCRLLSGRGAGGSVLDTEVPF